MAIAAQKRPVTLPTSRRTRYTRRHVLACAMPHHGRGSGGNEDGYANNSAQRYSELARQRARETQKPGDALLSTLAGVYMIYTAQRHDHAAGLLCWQRRGARSHPLPLSHHPVTPPPHTHTLDPSPRRPQSQRARGGAHPPHPGRGLQRGRLALHRRQGQHLPLPAGVHGDRVGGQQLPAVDGERGAGGGGGGGVREPAVLHG